MYGLKRHLQEAIEINRKRKSIYARMTDGASLALSNRLIFTEKMALLPAMWLELKARPFQKKGIPIIANDFVPMEHLPPPDTPPTYTGVASHELKKEVANKVDTFIDLVSPLVKKGKLELLHDVTYEMLTSIKNLEKQYQCHFAMLIHLLESMGYIAKNCMEYARKSGGDTKELAEKILQIHLIPIRLSLKAVDFPAQQFHQQGVGIIVNDLPTIPFDL